MPLQLLAAMLAIACGPMISCASTSELGLALLPGTDDDRPSAMADDDG
jgi:hypothetical protein